MLSYCLKREVISVSNLARKRLIFGRLLVRLQCTKPPLQIRSYVLLIYQNTCINSTKNERIGGVKSGKTGKKKGLGGAGCHQWRNSFYELLIVSAWFSSFKTKITVMIIIVLNRNIQSYFYFQTCSPYSDIQLQSHFWPALLKFLSGRSMRIKLEMSIWYFFNILRSFSLVRLI